MVRPSSFMLCTHTPVVTYTPQSAVGWSGVLPCPGAGGHLFRGPGDPSLWSHDQGRGAQCYPHLRVEGINYLSNDPLRRKLLIGRAVQRTRNAVEFVKLHHYELSASSCASFPIVLSALHSRPQSLLASSTPVPLPRMIAIRTWTARAAAFWTRSRSRRTG